MYTSFADLLEEQKEKNLPLWKLIQLEDCREEALTEEASWQRMADMYEAMKESDRAYDSALRSESGLVGGEAAKIRKQREKGALLSGDFFGHVMERALRVAENNACMKRIVAAPTAGSCGVLPAVLISLEEKYLAEGGDPADLSKRMVEALYVAGGIGGIIAERASLAGAECGCQAEIGSASSMAAGAAVTLAGGSPDKAVHAAALAMKSLLGLVCDPVAGLVEVPCVKRNVIGAVNALTAADMALSGIWSKIPADQVMDAMRSVGRAMNEDLRETGLGGLAATETGKAVRKKMSRR